MERTFKLDPKPLPKGFYILQGLLFIFMGSVFLFDNVLQPWNTIAGVFAILAGFGYIFLSPFKYSEKSRLFPKIKIDDDMIWAKTGFWSRPVVVRWEDIREIDLDSFKINFKLKKSSQSFRYNCYPEISIALKNAIREEADLRGIKVTGG